MTGDQHPSTVAEAKDPAVPILDAEAKGDTADDEAAAYYNDPEHRKLAGPAVRRQEYGERSVAGLTIEGVLRLMLTEHIPLDAAFYARKVAHPSGNGSVAQPVLKWRKRSGRETV